MVKFKRAFLGYNKREVNLELEDMDNRLSNALDSGKELKMQTSSLKEQNTDLKDRIKEYQEIERDLRDALIAGQLMAGRIMGEAKAQAETLNEEIQALVDRKAELQIVVDQAVGYLEGAKGALGFTKIEDVPEDNFGEFEPAQ